MKTSFEASNKAEEISLFKHSEILKNQYLFFNCFIISSDKINSLIEKEKISKIDKLNNIEIYYAPNYLYSIKPQNKIFENINSQNDKRYYFLKEHMFYYKFLLQCLQFNTKKGQNNGEKEIPNLKKINEISYRTLINRLYLLYDNPDTTDINFGKTDIFGVPCIYSITEPDIIDQIINMKKLNLGLMNMNEDRVNKLFGINKDIDEQSYLYNKILISISEGNSIIKEEGNLSDNINEDPNKKNKNLIEVEKNLINLSSELFLFHYITKQFDKYNLIQLPRMIFFCCLFDFNCKDIYQIRLEKMNKREKNKNNQDIEAQVKKGIEQLEDEIKQRKEAKNEKVKENGLGDKNLEEKKVKDKFNLRRLKEKKETNKVPIKNNLKTIIQTKGKNPHELKIFQKKIPIIDINEEKPQIKLNKKILKIQTTTERGKKPLINEKIDKNGKNKVKDIPKTITSIKIIKKEKIRFQDKKDKKEKELKKIQNQDRKKDIKKIITIENIQEKTEETVEKNKKKDKAPKQDKKAKEACEEKKLDKNIIKCDLIKFCGTLELDGAFKHKGEEKKLDTKSLVVILSESLNSEDNNIKNYVEKHESKFIIDKVKKYHSNSEHLKKIINNNNIILKNIELGNKNADKIIKEYEEKANKDITCDKNIIIKKNDLVLIENKREYPSHISNEIRNFIEHSLYFICLYEKLNLLEPTSIIHLLFVYDHYRNYNDEGQSVVELYKTIKENSEKLNIFKNNIKFYLIHSLPNLSISIFDKLDYNIREQNDKINKLNEIIKNLQNQIGNLKDELDIVKKSSNNPNIIPKNQGNSDK